MGYTPYETTVGTTDQPLTISLQPDISSLDEVIVVGYGQQRKRDVTGSIASIKGDALREVPTANIQQALQGRVAGLEVQSIGTLPGAGARIRIRGERSISGSNDPLLVLDGIPYEGNLNDINPADIVSIETLKDASATAIYGSRGANGVLLITTRRGQSGNTQLSYNGYYGLSAVAKKYPVFNADQYRAMRDLSTWSQDYLQQEREGIAIGRDIDWQDLMYENGHMTDHNVSISGGGEQARFSMGGGYFKQTTVLPGQDFGRYSLRATADFDIGKRVKVGLNSLNNLGNTNGSQFGINMFPILSLSPLMPPYLDDGSINRTPAGNLDDMATTYSPLLLKENDGSWVDRVRRFRSFNSLYGEVQIIDGLKYRLNVGADYRQEEGAQFRGTDSYFRPGINNIAYVNNTQAYSYTLENLLTYDKVFNDKHRLNLTGMYSFQEMHSHNSSAQKENITADFVQWYNLGQSAVTPEAVLGGGETTAALISYMLRANYSYDDRYMVTLTGRMDGSSRLAVGNKWAQYPAVSAGWNISNESFMADVTAISDLKLRVGYGVTSNQSIASYSTLGGVSSGDPNVRYNFGEESYIGYFVQNIVDPNLGWEYTGTVNVGVDFGLLNNRVTGSIDWYNARTWDMLYGINLPTTSGISAPYVTNIGSMSNKGLEISLSGNIMKSEGGFTWDADVNFFFNRNKLLKLNGEVTEVIASQLFVGHPLTAIYDLRKLGIWQLDEAEEAARYGAYPGQIKLEDNNGVDENGVFTGMPDGQINDDDRTIIGDGQARWQGGITTRFGYKGFDLSAVTHARIGGTLISNLHQPRAGYLTMLDGRRNGLAVDYWTPENPTNAFPYPLREMSAWGDAWTTLGYYDASFISVRSINLGYTLPNKTATKMGIQSLRVYLTAQNPFVLYSPYMRAGGVTTEATGTGYQGVGDIPNIRSGGQNPTLTVAATTPMTRTFILGLNVTF
nr:TonB-dependent receptor [Olivibacter sitiensis]